MNLKIQLFVRIAIIALISIFFSAVYLLYQTDHQAILQAEKTATRINQQMSAQMLRNFTRYDYRSPFPDSGLWSEITGLPGSCVQFLSRTESRRRNICSDINEADRSWPNWFGVIYSQLFHPEYEAKKAFSFNALTYGTILVTLNKQAEISRAWHNLQAVIEVLAISIAALALLVYLTINRMLRPAKIIVRGLENMREGQLDFRLPNFDVNEWRRTSQAINDLVANQQQVLAANQQLSLKLMNLQEEERRYIAGELHDEFGQCLAGINAITSSILHTAKTDCPALQPEAENIRYITDHMMTVLRTLLTRLRPTEVDDIGLSYSLKKLIKSWNQRAGNDTLYQLKLVGEIDRLPDPLPVNLYRIVQESLTNIAKHASATRASVLFDHMHSDLLKVVIEDNGINNTTQSSPQMGMGLLGMHERVKALGGELTFSSIASGGMRIILQMPVHFQQQDSV